MFSTFAKRQHKQWDKHRKFLVIRNKKDLLRYSSKDQDLLVVSVLGRR